MFKEEGETVIETPWAFGGTRSTDFLWDLVVWMWSWFGAYG